MQGLKQEKELVRNICRKQRNILTAEQKQMLDSMIYEKAWNLLGSMDIKTLYCYVSIPEKEADTHRLIETLLGRNITVAVPKCLTEQIELEHYIIKDLNDLKKGYFGISEPDENRCKKLSHPHKGICIVPGLAFDMNGIRLGYGKGFYDRFLEGFSGLKIGLCYDCCLYQDSLPHDGFDAVMDIIITESRVIYTN